ncbi:uncharacterized protein LOC142353168 [Convolutriloba macropyga]|uniref:uncharacterized protein LOC142353168 n=1 Tax=Convolutriloba macropyga TaxID=536237 RepID=UPI003F522ADD
MRNCSRITRNILVIGLIHNWVCFILTSASILPQNQEKEYWLDQFERKMPDIRYTARILKALQRLPPATRITASYVWPPVLDSDRQFDVTSRKHGLTKRPFGNYFPNGNDEKNANLNLMSG